MSRRRRAAVAAMFAQYTNADLIDEVDEDADGLTHTEASFVGALVDRLRKSAGKHLHTGIDFPLTEKQRRWLEDIAADKLPPKAAP